MEQFENGNYDISFDIELIRTGTNEDFGLEERLYGIQFSDIFKDYWEAIDAMHLMFLNLSIELTEGMMVQDRIRIVFFHDNFNSCIETNFVKRDNFTQQLLIDTFEKVIQSLDIDILKTEDCYRVFSRRLLYYTNRWTLFKQILL